MPWDDSYSTGHAEMDRQHRVLFGLIDQLDLEHPDAFDDDVQVVLDLIKYVIQHFGFEEELMQRYAYPDAAAHRTAHAALTRQVVELRNQLALGAVDHAALRSFLDDWLKHHIGNIDQRLAAFLAGRT